MKVILRNILFILLLGFLVKCSEDEVTSRNYPRLKTLPVSEITSEGARFNAEITFRGNFEVLNYGFVWGESENPTVENSERVIYSENIQANNFSAIIGTTLKDSISYFARAFIQTGEFTVYGENVQFTSLGGIAPELHSVNPLEAYRGDVVTIFGSGFSYQVNSIYFDGFLAEIISNSDSSLSVIIPEELTSVHPKIEIELLGRKAELVDALKLLGPTISSISRNQGIIGRDVLTLESSSITNSTTDYLVEINGVAFEIDVTELREGSISFYLPPSSPIGNYPFTLIKESERFLNDFQLDLVSPWVQKSSLPGSVFGTYGSTFVINGKIYFANSTSTDDKDFWEYDPVADEWNQKVDIPGPPYTMRIAFSIDNFGYIGTGDCVAYYCDTGRNGSSGFLKYSPDNDSWESLSYFVPLPAANGGLYGSLGFASNGKGYLFGGYGYYYGYFDFVQSNYWSYNPDLDNWEVIGDYQGFKPFDYLINSSGFVINDKIYLGLGQTDWVSSNNYDYTSQFWEYDPSNDSWRELTDFPGIPRSGAVGFTKNGKGYIGLGYNSSHGTFNDFWSYDPIEDQWRRIADLPSSPREGAVSAEVNNRAFVGFGTQENDLWEFE